MSLFSTLVEQNQVRLNELTYGGFKTKQKSITRLFPTFAARKKAIYANGGIRLIEQFPEVWWFKCASGTQPGVQYDVYLHFKNLMDTIKMFVGNKKLWNRAGNAVNYNALAPEVFNKVDFAMDCSCPADLYWGPEYIKTQRKAQFGDQENRPPRIRNPKQYGIVCKHQDDVLERLPFYTSTFIGFLKTFYYKEIQAMVDEIREKEKTELDRQEDINSAEAEGGA